MPRHLSLGIYGLGAMGLFLSGLMVGYSLNGVVHPPENSVVSGQSYSEAQNTKERFVSTDDLISLRSSDRQNRALRANALSSPTEIASAAVAGFPRASRRGPGEQSGSTDTLYDADPEVRANAVVWIADTGTEDDVPWLTEVAYVDDDPSVRVAALDSLVELAMEVPTEVLLTAMSDDSEIVRDAALAYMVELEPEEARYYLYERLDQVDDLKRVAVLRQLQEVGEEWAMMDYIADQQNIAEFDQNPYRRALALKQLGRLNTPEARSTVIRIMTQTDDLYTRRQASEILKGYF